MNGSNAAPPPQNLPPLTNLIRPENIAKLPNFNDQLRQKYIQGITNLWNTIRSSPEDSPEHQQAHAKLAEVTGSIREHMKKQALNAGTNGNRPSNPGQPVQDGRTQGQQPVQANAQPQQQQFSQNVTNSVAQLNLVGPPDLTARGGDELQRWMREMRQRYAQERQKHEEAQSTLQKLMTMAQNRQREGRALTQEEAQAYTGRKNQLEATMNKVRDFVSRFKAQQESFRQQIAARESQTEGTNEQTSSIDAMASTNELQPSQQPPLQPSVSEHQGHKDVNSALDAARQQAGSAGRNAMSPSNSQSGHPPGSHGPDPVIKKEPQASQPPIIPNTSGPPTHHNSPQVGQVNPHMPPSQTGPVPLSHRGAIQAAQSYSSQPNYQQSTPQSSTHGHPQLPNQRDPQNNNVKMPIPKELKVPPPQPVSMGPARPTLTGGPSNGALGQLGQPAIQKHPGFVLEGDGDRVLSKKKLQELVTQVTGVGGEGDDMEGLTPEVEETLLQVADDFIDQVVSSACKLAKLRGSSALEIRDLQLILERNYNIRVPGYASDELRTVKKVNPTTGWTQKMSAVQAAKVTGGKTDL